jgi:uncharacterized delta-60 repeat protein
LAFGDDGLVTANLLPPQNEFAWDAAPTRDDSFIVVGYLFTGDSRGPDMAVAKYSEHSIGGGKFVMSPSISFGRQGKTTFNLSPLDEVARGVAVQSTDKIVIGGYATGSMPGDNDFALLRLNTDGSLDTTFGGGGAVRTDFGSSSDEAYDVAVQSDDSIVLVGKASSFVTGRTEFAIARYSPDGALLSKTTTSFGEIGGALANGVAIRPDNSFVAVGQAVGPDGSVDFAMARYSAAGSLDEAFGDAGKVTTDFHGGFDIATAVTFDEFGRIIVAGNASGDGSIVRMSATRYTGGGSLDHTFAASGKFETAYVTNIGVANAFANDVNIDADGLILIAGSLGTSMGMGRLNVDGVLDTSFGQDGLLAFSFGDTGSAAANAVLPNPYLDNFHEDYILVGGSNSAGTADFALLSVGAGGTAHETALIDFSASDEIASAVVVQPDRKVVVAGRFHDPRKDAFDSDLLLVRFLENGNLDLSFGVNGYTTLDIESGQDAAVGLALQSDGSILVVGTTDSVTQRTKAVLARFTSTGQLDTGFGSGQGFVSLSLLPTHHTQPVNIALQNDGKIVMGGTLPGITSSDPFEATARQFIVRYLPNGELDKPFGSNPTTGMPDVDSYYQLVDYIVDIVPLDDGRYAVVGWGVTSSGITSGDVHATKLLIDENDRILLGGELQVGGNTQMVVTRFNPDGTLNNNPYNAHGFDADGLKVLPWGYFERNLIDEILGTYRYSMLESVTANAMGLQSNGKIISAGTKQRKAGGLKVYTDSLIQVVDDSGRLLQYHGSISVTDSDGPNAEIVDLIVQTDDKAVIVGTYGNQFWLTRSDADLLNDFDSFGTDDRVLTSFGATHKTKAAAAARTPDGKLVVVGHTRGAGVLGDDLAMARYELEEQETVGMNHPPAVVSPLAASTTRNTPVVIDVNSQVTDEDEDLVVIRAVGEANHGVTTITDNGILYTPTTDYFGSDSIIFTVSDGRGGTASGTVNVTVSLPYGDADGDGSVDSTDVDIVLAHMFMPGDWTDGDFDLNGVIDGSDFNLWNANKFTNYGQPELASPANTVHTPRAALTKVGKAVDGPVRLPASEVTRLWSHSSVNSVAERDSSVKASTTSGLSKREQDQAIRRRGWKAYIAMGAASDPPNCFDQDDLPLPIQRLRVPILGELG